MHNKVKHQRIRSTHTTVGLYSFVFAGKISVLAVLLLFVSFLIQPFHQVFANENLPVETAAVADSVEPQELISTEVPPPVEITQTGTSSISEPNYEQSIGTSLNNDESSTDSGQVLVDNGVELEPESAPAEDDSGGNQSDIPDPDIPIKEIVDDDTASSSEATTTPQDNRGDIVVVEETQNLVDNISSGQPQQVSTDENYYQFSKQSCAAIGDGTYHCSVNTDSDVNTDAVVFAEKDKAEGDMEIFLRTASGRVEQLTNNAFDDTSPHFDAESMQVVWQSLIDGRQQIIVYDLDKGEETQLTFARSNNMEPKASKDGIVWQAWDDNDWEIMFFDGKYTDQLTENLAQDVTPVIEDGYVVWSILGNNNQEAKVYSIHSGETLTITGHEGGSVVNPRFVLVYDTKFENGDVVTQGFDPATGLSAPISAKPAPEPVKIPDVDPIGEIRALIQNKSSQKEHAAADGVKADNSDGDLGIIGTSSATSSDILNLKQPNLDTTVVSSLVDTNFELTDYDLVIASKYIATSTTSKVNNIFLEDSSASSTQP